MFRTLAIGILAVYRVTLRSIEPCHNYEIINQVKFLFYYQKEGYDYGVSDIDEEKREMVIVPLSYKGDPKRCSMNKFQEQIENGEIELSEHPPEE